MTETTEQDETIEDIVEEEIDDFSLKLNKRIMKILKLLTLMNPNPQYRKMSKIPPPQAISLASR